VQRRLLALAAFALSTAASHGQSTTAPTGPALPNKPVTILVTNADDGRADARRARRREIDNEVGGFVFAAYRYPTTTAR
jgi:hypothetical protein